MEYIKIGFVIVEDYVKNTTKKEMIHKFNRLFSEYIKNIIDEDLKSIGFKEIKFRKIKQKYRYEMEWNIKYPVEKNDYTFPFRYRFDLKQGDYMYYAVDVKPNNILDIARIREGKFLGIKYKNWEERYD